MLEKRIWFDKKGVVRFISHLDLMRTMTKIVQRSGISLWYTEGFNPKPYVTFALPLSLGMESENDCFDIRLEGETSNEEILSSLKAVLPPLINIIAVTDPVYKPKEIASAQFDITFSDLKDSEKLLELIKSLLNSEELVVQKLGKKGRKKVLKDIDLMPYIKYYDVNEENGEILLRLVLPAGGETNINPSLLIDEIKRQSGEEDMMCLIRRNKLITKDGKDFC